jgi:hypothetical protein
LPIMPIILPITCVCGSVRSRFMLDGVAPVGG